jgi:sugar/nucleoside kinase (ribokinase family)
VTLLVFGWVALDDLETPAFSVERVLGGSAPASAQAAALFTEVRLLAAVGDDFPEDERAKLEGKGIDLAGLVTVAGGRTSHWRARYNRDLTRRDTALLDAGVNADWQPSLPPCWERSETLLVGPTDPVTQRAVFDLVPGARTTMLDTIDRFVDGRPGDLRETITRAGLLTLNESEARQLTGTASLPLAARRLLALGPSCVVIKLGEFGAMLRTASDYVVVPAYPLEDVVDPTGAGDAFAGAFLGYLDANPGTGIEPMIEALRYANVAASFQVEGIGASRLLSLTRAEVETRYAEFRSLVRS